MPITLAGLPAHPLVIHLAAVAVPVAALLCLVWAIRPTAFSGRGRLITFSVTIIGAVSMLAARFTGESLLPAMGLSEENPGIVQRHAELADVATVAVFALLASAVALLWVTSSRFNGRATLPAWSVAVLRVILGITAIASLVSIILVGHAGAELAWADFPNN